MAAGNPLAALMQGGGGAPGGAPQQSPMAAMMIPQLIQAIAGGGQPDPTSVGAAVRQQYADQRGADPSAILDKLRRHNELISSLFPIAVGRVADGAKGISQAVVGLNSAIKAFEKAQETLRAAAPAQPSTPIGLSFAQSSPDALGGM